MLAEFSSNEDARCCGSGTCIIDPQGRCWCGQQWSGQPLADPVPVNRSENDDAATVCSIAPADQRNDRT